MRQNPMLLCHDEAKQRRKRTDNTAALQMVAKQIWDLSPRDLRSTTSIHPHTFGTYIQITLSGSVQTSCIRETTPVAGTTDRLVPSSVRGRWSNSSPHRLDNEIHVGHWYGGKRVEPEEGGRRQIPAVIMAERGAHVLS